MREDSGNIRITRRELIAAGAALALPEFARADAPDGIPGPLRGRVIEVTHPGVVRAHKVADPDAVQAMMTRGMRELFGVRSEEEAWKRLFKPTDIVGIKLCMVGAPQSISQPETVRAVIRGLNLAGVPNKNIRLINRYQEETKDTVFEKGIAPDVRLEWSAKAYDDYQVALDGYDPSVYVEMPRVVTGGNPNNPVHRRSHACKYLTGEINKIVNVCVLKDHGSAGITMALKNMSHGFVNNVCRSHNNASDNWCDTFIPTVVSMPVIRRKVVLHIGDALVGGFDGGPGGNWPGFRTWDYGGIFFATDPVAMDRVGWHLLDKKRVAEGLPILAETGRKRKNPGRENFDYRQPEHVLIAGQRGLGESDLAKIEHRVIALKG